MKPPQIIELEKELGFELTETESIEDIFNDEKSKTYLLNNEQEVIGLNLSDCGLFEYKQGLFFLANIITLHYLCIDRNSIPHIEVNIVTSNNSDIKTSEIEYVRESIKKIEDYSFFYNMPNLKRVSLRKNGVIDISLILTNKNELSVLNLRDNQITDISPLASLHSISVLNFDYNKISNIAPLASLNKLTELYLGVNHISNISYLAQLQNLIILGLNGNQISDISYLLNLKNIEQLYLAFNQISDISYLLNLKKLTILDLRANQISDISLSFLNYFQKLEVLRLHGNPIQNIPKEIFDKENENVLEELRNYFQDGEKYGWDENKELKIILIGNGNVGKTSLINRLVGNFFVENYQSTHGIQLKKYDKLEPYNINIWDFGGQDIYHATHRLFMQTRALFLVLWDWETENTPFQEIEENGKINLYQNHELDYWLNYVDVLGKGSKVIVVQTKTNGEKKHPKESELKDRYTDIWLDSISIDSKIDDWDLNGFEALKVAIRKAIKTTDLLRKEQLPKNWIAQRESIHNLLNEGKPTIDYDYFVKELCKDNPLSPDTILGWLSDSGVVFYRKGLFENKIIINQQWAIDAVYTLFDRNKVFYELVESNKQGKFKVKQLNHVWGQYKEEEQELFLSFMTSCEICFELTDSNTPFEQKEFIAPALCSGNKPSATDEFWRNQKNCLHFGFQYKFLHYGNIQSFIVQTGKKAQENGLWKYGIWAKSGEHNFLVEAFPEEKQILISITRTSVFSKEKLGEIRKQFEYIHSIKNLIRNFISIDGKEFVWFDECDEQRRLGNPYVKSWSGKSLKVEDFNVFLFSIVDFVTEAGEELPEQTILETKKIKPMEIPEFFIADLKKQVEEQYKKIIRNRDLRNDEIDENLREKYAKEIALRQKNIQEIQTEFLNQIKAENANISEIDIKNISNAIVEAVRKELDGFKLDLMSFMQIDLKTALAQINLPIPATSLEIIQEEITFLQQEHKDGVLALANLILDVADKQEDTDKSIAKLIPLIKEIKSSDVLDVKLKLVVPLLEYLGIAKIEAEAEIKPLAILDKIKSFRSGKK